MICQEELDIIKSYIENQLLKNIKPKKKVKTSKDKHVSKSKPNKNTTDEKIIVYHDHLPNEHSKSCQLCK